MAYIFEQARALQQTASKGLSQEHGTGITNGRDAQSFPFWATDCTFTDLYIQHGRVDDVFSVPPLALLKERLYTTERACFSLEREEGQAHRYARVVLVAIPIFDPFRSLDDIMLPTYRARVQWMRFRLQSHANSLLHSGWDVEHFGRNLPQPGRRSARPHCHFK